MAASQVLVTPNPQNSFLDDISQATSIFGGLAENVGKAYSSFIGAKATLIGAKAQSNQIALQPTISQLNAIDSQAKYKNTLVIAGLLLAATGASVLLYRAFK